MSGHEERTASTIPGLLDDAERTRWLALVTERFGMPTASFDGFDMAIPNAKTVHLVPRALAVPARPEPASVGLPFLRIHLRYPKLTTGAAMQFGTLATRNAVDATDEQADHYLARERFLLTTTQRDRCTGMGYVLVRYHELTLGVGLYLGAEKGVVTSMFPKAWPRAEPVAAPHTS